MNEPDIPREVVSFVRRSTRMNTSQHKAWQTGRERWMVEVPRERTDTSVAPDAHVDWATEFGRTADLVVEIGSGKGHSLAAMAAADPERDHVAFEVFQPALASTMIKLKAAGVDNVRLVEANGATALERLFEPASVAELWTFFPDPWHKSRHAKRRLVQADFGALVASRLTPSGVWRIATDWAEYAEHCRQVLDEHPDLENVHLDPDDAESGWAPRLPARPVTKYEQRGLDAGRAVFDLTYRRRR